MQEATHDEKQPARPLPKPNHKPRKESKTNQGKPEDAAKQRSGAKGFHTPLFPNMGWRVVNLPQAVASKA